MSIEGVERNLERWIHPVSKLMSRIASVILVLMMFLTVTDVFLRKVFNRSILGTVEVSEFLLLIIIFFTLAETEIFNGHVKVDLVIGRFGGRVQAMVDMVTQIVCFFLCGLITWSTLVYSEQMRASGEVSQDLWIPIYPFVYIVAVGCAILALTVLINFLKAFMKVVKS
jgi:TRAP-type mannitol/chloroaromatic compound transport system permease small subunit